MHAGEYPRAAGRDERSIHRKSRERDRRTESEAREPKRKIASYQQYIRERWRGRLDAARRGRKPARSQSGVGDYDNEIALALRFGWTPEQIGRLDPDYLEELIARLQAESD